MPQRMFQNAKKNAAKAKSKATRQRKNRQRRTAAEEYMATVGNRRKKLGQ